MPSFDNLLYERPRPKMVRILLKAPEARNGADPHLLYELNDAFGPARQGDDVSGSAGRLRAHDSGGDLSWEARRLIANASIGRGDTWA